jgi:alpha-glucosidase
MIKDEALRDNPVNPAYEKKMATYEQLLPVYSTDQPEVHEVVKKMRDILDEYPERMMIGEIYLPINKLMAYYGINNKGAHLPFNFQLITLPWKADVIALAIDQYEGALPQDCWPNWVMGNHDQSRITSRIGMQQARIAAMLLLTIRGTPTIYYGEEIGMRDVAIPPNEIKDPQGLNMPDKNLSRDPSRTPMQWDQSDNAGFTTGKPWLRLDKSSYRENVALQKTDPFSMLWLYKRLIELRQSEPALSVGSYKPVYADDKIIAYTREAGDTRFLIVLNLTHKPAYFKLEGFSFSGTVEISSFPELDGIIVMDTINLDGDVGLIIRLKDKK